MTTETELYQSVQDVSQSLADLAVELHPVTFAPWLSAVIRQVAITMPEEYWKDFSTGGTEPCETPGCTCHHQTKLLVMLMDVHRKKGKEGGFCE